MKNYKATYIGKSYDRDYIYLEYEYRGRTYEVYENRAKGNEPLRWQHANAQARIDNEIELEEKSKMQKQEPIDMDEIFNMLGW